MSLDDVKKIYGRLQDDISRKLFTARFTVSMTGEAGHITMLPAEYRNLSADIENFRDRLLAEDGRKTAIFGAGMIGRSIVGQFPLGTLHAFIDNYRAEGEMDGLPVLSFDSYRERFGVDGTRFVIAILDRQAAGEMYGQLMEAGVSPEAVLVFPAEYRNSCGQYFDFEPFAPGEHETFVDCGCYDGSTAFHFAGWCAGKGYDKIWCFEPDEESYQRCKRVCGSLKNCTLYPYGISDRSGTAYFSASGKEGARIEPSGETAGLAKIETVALDELLGGERVTFIKMDLEGAELSALKGAAEIIRRQKPKLAISIYHKDEDILEIPRLILELCPDYKLDIRHYSVLLHDTVLYAY